MRRILYDAFYTIFILYQFGRCCKVGLVPEWLLSANLRKSPPEGELENYGRDQTALMRKTAIFSKSEWNRLVEELSLTRRQAQIARYLFTGCSDTQIAIKLKIAVPTVRTHLARLFFRLQVQDRHEVLLHIFRHFRRGCRTDGCPRWQ